jgi:hypothetical protein
MPVRARLVQTSTLAAALAPPRQQRLSRVPVVVAAIIAMCGALNVVNAAAAGELGALAGAAAICVVATGGLLSITRRRRAGNESERVIALALWLWRHCWYCGRCGLVSLLTPAAFRILPAANLAAAVLALASKSAPNPPLATNPPTTSNE